MLRNSFFGSIGLASLALLSACSALGDDGAATGSAATESFSPYPTTLRPGMTKLSGFDPSNASVADFGTAVRDQGSIASCASFGFLGLLENQLFNQRGIAPDLSERFMLYSNFLQTGTLGGAPDVIARFPTLVANLGLLTEDAYPYAAVNANASRFDQDAAQGLQTDHAQPSLASAIAGTTDRSQERSDILQRAEFIGALPQGPYPITLPVKARLVAGAKVPEIEYHGKIYSCFSTDGATAAPASSRLAVSPREFLSMCFDLDPTEYFSCAWDLSATAARVDGNLTPSGDACVDARAGADAIATEWLAASQKNLRLTLSLLARGEAILIGVKAPQAPNNAAPIWSTRNAQPGSGHAVLAEGYVTYDELTSPDEQKRGLLGAGLFDRLAATVEPAYAQRLAAGLPTDVTALRDLRVASKLGDRLKSEGGLLLFRNSWGASAQGVAIGVEGHQAMTFEYFLASSLIVAGRSQPSVAGVAWSRGAGPSYCPATVDVPFGGAWLASSDRATPLRDAIRAAVVPSTCPP